MSFKIDKLSVSNFRSIENTEITLVPGINIFIGENGSGKSNVLQFIYSYFGVSRILFSRKFRLLNTKYAFTFSPLENNNKEKYELLVESSPEKKGRKIEYLNELILRKTQKNIVIFDETQIYEDVEDLAKSSLYEELMKLRGIKKKYIRFNLPDDDDSFWVSTHSKIEIDKSGLVNVTEQFTSYSIFYFLEANIEDQEFTSLKFEEDENNFQEIKNVIIDLFDEFKTFYEIDENLLKFSPIQEIRLNPNINIFTDSKKIFIENLIIDFKINNNWVSWNYLSDGTKRLFYLITEAISLRKGILLIEEPELGVHPNQLFRIMEFLKDQALSKQIIISTHSPIVLDILNPKELKNIVITKMTSNGTKLKKLNKKEIVKAQEYMKEIGDLSTYWLHSDLENND